MRLIDADKIGLTNFEIFMCDGDYKTALKMILDKIDNAPEEDIISPTITKLEEMITIYRDAKLYGEVFGLKIALDMLKAGKERENE